MKTNKSKPQKKNAQRAAKKQIEQSLSERFLEAVKGLGHNAELIADDIAKLSKAAAKKLSKRFEEVKTAVEGKIDNQRTGKQDGNRKIKLAKKDASKLMKKVDKSITKVVKKAVKKAKPVATSVQVQPAGALQQATASSIIKANPKETKESKASAKSAKKAVVKAVTNNPVKKVSVKAIPAKANTTSEKERDE